MCHCRQLSRDRHVLVLRRVPSDIATRFYCNTSCKMLGENWKIQSLLWLRRSHLTTGVIRAILRLIVPRSEYFEGAITLLISVVYCDGICKQICWFCANISQ